MKREVDSRSQGTSKRLIRRRIQGVVGGENGSAVACAVAVRGGTAAKAQATADPRSPTRTLPPGQEQEYCPGDRYTASSGASARATSAPASAGNGSFSAAPRPTSDIFAHVRRRMATTLSSSCLAEKAAK